MSGITLNLGTPESAARGRELVESLAARMEDGAGPRAFSALEGMNLAEGDHALLVMILKAGPGALGEDDPQKIRALKRMIRPGS